MVDLNETINKVKSAGKSGSRIVIDGDGKCSVEVKDGAGWSAVITGISKTMAEEIMSRASDRLLLG